MLDIHDLMRGLAEKRPVFHNEADFQFALASHIREECKQPVRLEWMPFQNEPTVAAKTEYKCLGEHLASRPAKPWRAPFAELERILGEPLPDEATSDRNWWANCCGAPQAKAWMAAGWRVSRVDIGKRKKTVHFRRPRMYVDLWLPEERTAIELKYATRKLRCVAQASDLRPPCESFSLRDKAAHDLMRYDFLKDLERLEWVLDGRPDARRGLTVLLTNDPLYWKWVNQNRIDKAFQLHQGRTLCRKPQGMDWKGAGEGTKQGRDVPIVLNGSYRMDWKCYSVLNGDREARNRTFRYLAVEVSRSSAGAPAGESPKNQPGPAPSP